MGSKISWDEYFLEMARTASLRADCTRSKVGAILVGPDHRIISAGYNGAPPGAPGCLTENACPRGRLTYNELPSNNDYSNCIAIHAERNAILYAARSLRPGSTLYVTRRPCTDCQLLAMFEGVVKVFWYSWESGEICSMPLIGHNIHA